MFSHPLAATVEVPLDPPPHSPVALIELLSDQKCESVQVLNAYCKGLWATTAWEGSHDANAGSFFTKCELMEWCVHCILSHKFKLNVCYILLLAHYQGFRQAENVMFVIFCCFWKKKTSFLG